MPAPVLFIDLSSPYAYLASERAAAVLGADPRHEPVVLGAIFRMRGRGSWGHTEEREAGMAEVERRARAYGLPPVAWTPGWPRNSLHAHRAVLWAERHDAARELIRVLFRAVFVDGRDIEDPRTVRDGVEALALDPAEMEQAIQGPAMKEALKARTAGAWEAGVRGIPTLRVGDELFFGDDQLEAAAARVAGARG